MTADEPSAGRLDAAALDWWDDLDQELIGCFADGPISIETVARRLRVPEQAAISLVALLACQGRVCIRTVELTGREKEASRMEPSAISAHPARPTTGAAGTEAKSPEAGAPAVDLAGVSALVFRESWRLWLDMQHATLTAAGAQQAALVRWPMLWAELWLDPWRGYRRALEQSVDLVRRALALARANAQAIGEAADRLQSTTRQGTRRAA